MDGVKHAGHLEYCADQLIIVVVSQVFTYTALLKSGVPHASALATKCLVN
jgi:hypothetical protein